MPSTSSAIVQLICHYFFVNVVMQLYETFPEPLWLILLVLRREDPSHPNSGPRHSPETNCPLRRSLSLSLSRPTKTPIPLAAVQALEHVYSLMCLQCQNDFDSDEN